jgi:hypothetical protein
MSHFNPDKMDSRGYRQALASMLAQFIQGEEISFTAVPIGLEFLTDEALVAQGRRQLEDEKRHHGMFESERVRLNLPRESPNEVMLKFYDIVIDRMKRRDVIGGVIPGTFMLEGAAFSTLLTHCEYVDEALAETFREIVADEARHITLNVAVVRELVGDDPASLQRLVEVHAESLPLLFDLFHSFQPINAEIGVDNEWFTMRCLFHHSQRIRRLHLPSQYAKAMLSDTVAVAQHSR